MTKPPTVDTAKIRCENSPSGTSGSGTRRSTITNSGSSASPIAGDQDLRRRPRVGRAAPRQREQQPADGHAEQERARDVDAVLAPPRARHRLEHDGERQPAERQVDQEDPAPRGRVGQRPAEQRPRHGGEPPHRADEALVLAALARREEVGDRRLRERQQAAGADALQRAAGDELAHRLRRAAQQRADEEDRDRHDEQPPAPVEVRQLPVQRHGDRRGEQVGGDHPRQLLEALQVGGDLGQRRGHDRLVQRGQQRCEHDRAERRDELTPRQRLIRPGHDPPP